MLRSNASFVKTTVLAGDLLCLMAALLTTMQIQALVREPQAIPPGGMAILLASLPVWLLGLGYSGAYESLRQKPWWSIIAMVLRIAAVVGVLMATCFYLSARPIPRFITIGYPALAAVYLSLFRLGGLALVRQIRHIGFNRRYVLIVGADESALRYGRYVQDRLDWGLRLVGFLSDETGPREFLGVPVLGQSGDLRRILLERPVDRVIFSVAPETLPRHLAICEELGVEAVFIPHFDHLHVAKIHVENFFGLPVINYTMTPQQLGQLFLKQAMDFAFSFLAVVILSPFFLLFALAIRLDSRGPVFFRQRRATLHGRTFVCYKFRTMFTDAEERLAGLRSQNEMSGPVFKMRNDPRITRVGRFLRKFSLDELPQLFNVLVGDMSLVGPRPGLPAEVQQYQPWQRRRLSMKPGLTCLWQVSGRNNINFDQWMQLDLDYIDHWSLALDVKLLFKTIPAVVRGTGM